jgi:hypothetical protein
MPMQHPRRDHHHRSRRHVMAGETIRSECFPDNDEGRRIKPQRLLHDGAGDAQRRQCVRDNFNAEVVRSRLRGDPLLPLRRQREEIEAPEERQPRRCMPGDD